MKKLSPTQMQITLSAGNADLPFILSDYHLIIVPAASVDRSGMRMGWGRGYFDKTLGSMENCPPVYAVIFDHELVDTVPSERHDQRVDGVVTPSGIVAFR